MKPDLNTLSTSRQCGLSPPSVAVGIRAALFGGASHGPHGEQPGPLTSKPNQSE
jgi:hypothetical protein